MHNHLKARHPVEVTSGQQQSVAAFMVRSTKMNARRAEQLTALLAKMVAKDMLPISFVEGEGFRELMNFVEPEYKVLCRKTITSRLEKLHIENASILRNDLENADKVSLTTDSWTALTTESYVTVTCHYMLEWEMRSAVLQTKAMPERHTADNLANVLSNARDHCGLTGKVTACVHDNASNIVLANSQAGLGWDSQPCFAHTLQLATNDGFKLQNINHVVKAANRLVSHFHHSTVATEALKQKQQLQNVPGHKLVQSCRTRWNSIYDMFERLLEQRWAVCAVLSDRTVTKLPDARTLELADDSWTVMGELMPVLHSLKCATTALCGESNVSLSMIYPVVANLLSKHLKEVPEESNKVTNFKKNVATSLKARLAPADTSSARKVAYIASFLDPRHKHLRFTTDEVRDTVQAEVRTLLSMADDQETEEAAECDEGPSEPKHPRKDCLSAAAIAVLFGEEYSAEGATYTTELTQYCQDVCPPLHTDPLTWWKANQKRYPRLAKLASAYLCVPATSVPSERVFSAAGLIVNRLRTRLHPEHVDMLIFLNKNMQ
ncbi:E3 SUMO-protein ligase ZBED1-like [Eleginops maclovinus]|uniref:E3 SUMO-protein ligase ZBED1-like n=1 Tax=Eleginops maclovinus TaxID=56733 RepID=UPI003080E175